MLFLRLRSEKVVPVGAAVNAEIGTTNAELI